MCTFRRLSSKLFPNTATSLDGIEQLNSLSQMLLYRRRLVERCYPGAYTINPYMFRAVQKLERLVERYMESIGAQRLLMPTLSPAPLWEQTGRWANMGSELFRVKDRNDNDMCLAPTHEETICSVMSKQNLSHKSLPLLLYQISNKFRDEPHPKHALLRSREFIMKDLYTFDADEEHALVTYDSVIRCYEALFQHLSLDVRKVTASTGNIGGTISHEFHLETRVGEDTLKVCQRCGHAFNSEVVTPHRSTCQVQGCPGIYEELKGTELAHAFLLGERYSKPLQVTYRNRSDRNKLVYMGCYGIGITRLLAAAVESLSSKDHMKMPRAIVPYNVLIIPQKKGYKYAETREVADRLYDCIERDPRLRGEVVMDDRVDHSIGFRLREAKLLGYPLAICVNKKALPEENSTPQLELIDLYKGQADMIDLKTAVDRLSTLVGNLEMIPGQAE
ncbi:probable proline--tRNA ligase, mitochondrial [Watersipora subatra]|uniref:probable proline--tRNA ligase, mitochondrial n=1 Tax=Watersipora subatra TaxID=2589382 RepID=UPI00355C899B